MTVSFVGGGGTAIPHLLETPLDLDRSGCSASLSDCLNASSGHTARRVARTVWSRWRRDISLPLWGVKSLFYKLRKTKEVQGA